MFPFTIYGYETFILAVVVHITRNA